MSAELNREQIHKIATVLLEAEDSRQSIIPLTDQYPGLDVEEAYQIQLRLIELKKGRGAVIVGKKAGVTSKAIQQMFGVSEPDYGHLLDDMIVSEGDVIEAATMLQPKAEPEIGFILSEDLRGPGVNAADVLARTKYVVPVLEIIDSRVNDWKIRLPDTIADNASGGRVVVGGTVRKIDDLDLRLTGVVMEKNGEVIATGAGAAVLGNPANAVAWLANKLSSMGQILKANELVLPGSLTQAVSVTAGDYVHAHFDRLGSVGMKFV